MPPRSSKPPTSSIAEPALGELTVHVRVFAALADALGVASGTESPVRLARGASIADLWRRLAEPHPDRATVLERWRGRTAIALNGRLVGSESRLQDGDEIALLPPVSGG